MIIQADQAGILRAASLLSHGEVVGFPTETVYGLGGNAFNEAAVRKIYALKERPQSNPLICHVASGDKAELAADLSVLTTEQLDFFQQLASRYWPGPLTILLPRRKDLPLVVTAGGGLVGVRVPYHKIASDMLGQINFPVAAPSANKYTKLSAIAASQVEEAFGSELAILDGGLCHVGIESTVVDIKDGISILRSGFVTYEDLHENFGDAVRVGGVDAASSPGQHKIHYAPRTPLNIRDGVFKKPTENAGLIVISGTASELDLKNYSVVETLSPKGDLVESASKLYDSLHRLDRLALDFIDVEPCLKTGIGAAIMDRLRRAAANFLKE